MSTSESMADKRLAEARAALDGDMLQWLREYGADLAAEVEQLRALSTVDAAMVERALRYSYGPKAWQEMCDSEEDSDAALVATSRAHMWGTLDAALNTKEEA